MDKLEAFQGSLVGFSGEQVHVKGHITLKTMSETKQNAKMVKVRYFVINTPFLVDMIIRRSIFNLLGRICVYAIFVYEVPVVE